MTARRRVCRLRAITAPTCGFTLIELLAVIGIIAILMAILFPVIGRARQQANLVKCLANQKQLMQASILYTQEWRGYMPFPNQSVLEDPAYPSPNGWLYNYGTLSSPLQQSDVQNGLLWPYLRDY